LHLHLLLLLLLIPECDIIHTEVPLALPYGLPLLLRPLLLLLLLEVRVC
jgi:hypothetical protein